MKKISAVVIAKNSENIIQDCLKSLSFCDETIVIDGQSTDGTVSLAKKLGATVYNGQSSNFAQQRNIGLEKAAGEWILYIDTDERVSDTLKNTIQQVLTEQVPFAAYKLQRKNFYLGNHEWPKIEKLERLFKKDTLVKWKGQLHESPEINGRVGELAGFLLHYTHRDLSSMLEKTNQWSVIEAQLRFDSKHPKMSWWRFFRVLVSGFYDSYIKQSGFKAGTAGLIESMYQGFSLFITYAKLWEMQQNNVPTHIPIKNPPPFLG